MAKLKHENGPFDIDIGRGKGQVDAETALELTPTVALPIALFIGHHAIVEMMLPGLFADILAISPTDAAHVLGCTRSSNSKIDMISASLASSHLEKDKKEEIEDVLSELRWLNQERNRYAHALYIGTGELGVIRRRSFHADTFRKASEDLIDTEDVELHCARAKRLQRVMWKLTKHHGQFDFPP